MSDQNVMAAGQPEPPQPQAEPKNEPISKTLAEMEELEKAQIQALRQRMEELRIQEGGMRNQRRTLIGVFGGMFVAAGIMLGLHAAGIIIISNAILIAALGLCFTTIVFAAAGFALPVEALKFQRQELADELDLRQMSSSSHEQKAHKLLRIQQGQLTQYLTVILSQSKAIFIVGIFAMLVGVGIVVFAIWQTRIATGETEKIIVAVLGAIGAILTNFVAAIYLKMFGDIGQAVQRSVGSLTQSTNLNFANVIISKIDDNPLRRTGYKELALKIAEAKGP